MSKEDGAADAEGSKQSTPLFRGFFSDTPLYFSPCPLFPDYPGAVLLSSLIGQRKGPDM